MRKRFSSKGALVPLDLCKVWTGKKQGQHGHSCCAWPMTRSGDCGEHHANLGFWPQTLTQLVLGRLHALGFTSCD